jgi:hypothetical protein
MLTSVLHGFEAWQAEILGATIQKIYDYNFMDIITQGEVQEQDKTDRTGTAKRIPSEKRSHLDQKFLRLWTRKKYVKL